MQKLWRKNKVAWVVVFLCVVGSLAWSFMTASQNGLFLPSQLTEERIHQLRTLHPVSYVEPPTIYVIELSFSDILDLPLQAVIVAEVVKPMPQYTIDIIRGKVINPSSPEYTDHLDNEMKQATMNEASFTSYQVKVEEVIVGKMDSEFINISYNSAFIGSEPDLQIGSRIVVALSSFSSHPVGTYGFTKYGTYYVVDDHYVLSAYESKEQGELGIQDQVMNGKKLTALKTTIRDYYKP